MSRNTSINDLKTALSTYSSSLSKNIVPIKLLLKELMSYVCRGIDLSSLYENVILLLAANDAEIFKMTSQILIQYARLRTDCAPMCINSFRKEFVNEDPAISSYALKMLSYFEAGTYKLGINHSNALTRATALMNIITDMKVHFVRFNLQMDDSATIINSVKKMLQDSDNSVVLGAIRVLYEIYGDYSWIDNEISALLISKFPDYTYETKAELLELNLFDKDPSKYMKLLREPITQNLYYNSVLTNCYLNNAVELIPFLKVLISRWIIIYMTGDIDEKHVAISCLHHLVKLGEKNQPGFKKDVFPNSLLNIFYCNWYMPEDFQIDQIYMLKLLANHENADIIYEEVQNYICTEVSKLSNRNAQVVLLIMKLAELSENVKEQLVSMCCMFTKLPFFWFFYLFNGIELPLHINDLSILPYVTSSEKKLYTFDFEAECLHAAGHYASYVTELPPVLEKVITFFEQKAQKKENAEPLTDKSEQLLCYHRILLALLVSSVKTFIAQPEVMSSILIRVFDLLLNDPSVSIHVKERALFYHSLLKFSAENEDFAESLSDILFKEHAYDDTVTKEDNEDFGLVEYTGLTFNDPKIIDKKLIVAENYQSELVKKLLCVETIDDFLNLNNEENDSDSEQGCSISKENSIVDVSNDNSTIYKNDIYDLPVTSQLLNETEISCKQDAPESVIETNKKDLENSQQAELFPSTVSVCNSITEKSEGSEKHEYSYLPKPETPLQDPITPSFPLDSNENSSHN